MELQDMAMAAARAGAPTDLPLRHVGFPGVVSVCTATPRLSHAGLPAVLGLQDRTLEI